MTAVVVIIFVVGIAATNSNNWLGLSKAAGPGQARSDRSDCQARPPPRPQPSQARPPGHGQTARQDPVQY